MKKQIRGKVGTVAVDSGTVMLIDPCSLAPLVPKAEEPIEHGYEKTVRTNWDIDKDVSPRQRGKAIPPGHLVSSGRGDGFHGVEVRKNSAGRIAELRIRCIDDDE